MLLECLVQSLVLLWVPWCFSIMSTFSPSTPRLWTWPQWTITGLEPGGEGSFSLVDSCSLSLCLSMGFQGSWSGSWENLFERTSGNSNLSEISLALHKVAMIGDAELPTAKTSEVIICYSMLSSCSVFCYEPTGDYTVLALRWLCYNANIMSDCGLHTKHVVNKLLPS